MRLLLWVLLWLCLPFPSFAAELRLSVAASMTDAVKELAAAYENRVEGVSILPNFASSGALAKQIAQGAPADLFISANPRWMDYLVEQGRIAPASVRPLARNALVFVGRKGRKIESLEDLAGLSRIAMGSPGSVPAGQYARQALEAAGLYEDLSGRLVMAQSVRQALVYADRGEVDGAFVYRTDALLAQHATLLLEVPASLHDPVLYPAGLTLEGAARSEAQAFYRYLATEEAAGILKKYGFLVP